MTMSMRYDPTNASGTGAFRDPVTDSWDELDEHGNKRTVEESSWKMVKEIVGA